MGLTLVTAPANQPVTLDEAKAHLRVDFTDDDDMIEALIEAASGWVDGPNGFLGRALIDQTWDLYLDHFPCGPHRHQAFAYHHGHRRHRHDAIEIPLPPLIEVLGVYYLDTTGNEQLLDESLYTVDPTSETNQPGRIIPAGTSRWPQTSCDANSVRIRFRAGYIDSSVSPATDNVPRPIRAAILLHIGDLYSNRETMVVGERVAPLPWAAEQLLRPYRVTMSMA